MDEKILFLLFMLWLTGCQVGGENSLIEPIETIEDGVIYNTSFEEMNTSEKKVIYNTSFESVLDIKEFYITPQNHMETTSHSLSTEFVKSGEYSHKAWFKGTNPVIKNTNTNHRGYPTIQMYKIQEENVVQNKIIVEFWVWLDIELTKSEGKDWFSFATLTSYADDTWARTLLVNLDSDGIVHFMHVPDQTKKNQDIFQTDEIIFPMKEWVKLKIYVDYTNENEYEKPYAKAYLNDQLVSAATFNPRINPMAAEDRERWPSCLDDWDLKSISAAEELCDLNYVGGLAQAHFGMYAPPLVEEGVVYNDDLVIYEVE